MTIFTLFSKDDYLDLQQQKEIINTGLAQGIYSILNFGTQNAVHLSLEGNVLVTLPQGFGAIELTKYASASTLLNSELLPSLINSSKLYLIKEAAFLKATGVSIPVPAVQTEIQEESVVEGASTQDGTDLPAEPVESLEPAAVSEPIEVPLTTPVKIDVPAATPTPLRPRRKLEPRTV